MQVQDLVVNLKVKITVEVVSVDVVDDDIVTTMDDTGHGTPPPDPM